VQRFEGTSPSFNLCQPGWRQCVAVAVATASWVNPASCQTPDNQFRAIVSLLTDYRFRGISQTNEDPALQAGLDFEHRTGIFAGIWGSNIEFESDANEPDPRDIELDFYLGFGAPIAGNWSSLFSVTFYKYPGASIDYDYLEFSAGVNYKELIFGSIAYSPDVYSEGLSSLVYEVGAEYPLINNFSVNGTVGYFDASTDEYSSYTYWDAGVTKRFEWITVDLRYHGTSDKAKNNPIEGPAGDQIVLGASIGLEF